MKKRRKKSDLQISETMNTEQFFQLAGNTKHTSNAPLFNREITADKKNILYPWQIKCASSKDPFIFSDRDPFIQFN